MEPSRPSFKLVHIPRYEYVNIQCNNKETVLKLQQFIGFLLLYVHVNNELTRSYLNPSKYIHVQQNLSKVPSDGTWMKWTPQASGHLIHVESIRCRHAISNKISTICTNDENVMFKKVEDGSNLSEEFIKSHMFRVHKTQFLLVLEGISDVAQQFKHII